MNISIVLAILSLIFYICRYLANYYRRWRVVEKCPGPPAWPFVGNIHQVPFDATELSPTFEAFIDQFRGSSEMIRFWVGTHPIFLPLSPNAMQEVLRSTSLIEKSKDYDYLRAWMGDGLLLSKGTKWHSRRKLITKSFHFSILDTFIPVMFDKASILIDRIYKISMQTPDVGIEFYPLIGEASLDIICETAMGINAEIQTSSKNTEYFHAVERVTKAIVNRGRYPWLWPSPLFYLLGDGFEFDRCLKIVHSFSRTIILERKAWFQSHHRDSDESQDDCPNQKPKMSFLDNLLSVQAISNLSDDDIWEEVETFMFEGHDTTATGITWAIFIIGHQTEAQQKAFEEVDDILDNECPTADTVRQLRYLHSVIKECLRLAPPVPFYSRNVVQDTKIGSYDIPKGSTLMLIPYAVHFDPKHYGEDAKQFNADRFLDDGNESKHPFAYITFSAGQRNCIGQRFALQEMTIVIALIIKRFKIESITPSDKITHMNELVSRPSIPMKIRFIPRNEIYKS